MAGVHDIYHDGRSHYPAADGERLISGLVSQGSDKRRTCRRGQEKAENRGAGGSPGTPLARRGQIGGLRSSPGVIAPMASTG